MVFLCFCYYNRGRLLIIIKTGRAMEKRLFKTVDNNSIGRYNLAKGFLLIIIIFHHTLNIFSIFTLDKLTDKFYLLPLFIFYGVMEYGVISLFFTISGIGFYPLKNSKKVKKRIAQILKLYIIVALIIVLLMFLKEILKNGSMVVFFQNYALSYILGICPTYNGFGMYIFSIGPIWFLIALLNATLIMSIVMKVKLEKYRTIIVLGLVVLGYVASRMIYLPFCIFQSLMVSGYIYFGYIIREKDLLNKKINKIIYILMSIYLIFIMFFGYVAISENIYRLGLLDILATYIAAFLFLKIYHRFDNVRTKITALISRVGKYSLWILCIHTLEYMILPWRSYGKYLSEYKIIAIPLAFVIRCIFIYCIFKLIIIYKKKIKTGRVI
jgi:hypothetical protein